MTVGATVQLETVKKTSAALLAVPLAASLLLTACGGDTKPGTSPPTTTSTPSAATSPTTTALKTDPNIPAAARAHTPAGAEAFVRYFYSQLNIAWSRPRAGLISSLSAAACKTCGNFEQEAAKSVTKNERVIGQSIVLSSVDTSDATNSGKMTVLAIGYQPKTVVVDAKGKPVQTLRRERVRTLVTVRWNTVGWRVDEIQSVA
jgi:hypothetical protein